MDSNWENFLKTCKRKKYSEKDVEKFEEAKKFLEKKIKKDSEKRRINHNLNIGKVLLENQFLNEVVISGILYKIEKLTDYNEIEERFGKEIANIIKAQRSFKETKKKNILAEPEELRKILLMTVSDTRVIFIKLANELVKLRNIKSFQKEEKNKFLEDIFEIYIPLSNRLGLEKIRKELEEKAFKESNLKKYNEIKKFVKKTKTTREDFVEECKKNFSRDIKSKVKNFKIKGREKSIYSIYKKIVERKVPLDKQRDLFGVRIITKTKEECYNILGILLEKYNLIEGSFKDYIRNPKPNGYESLHVTIKIEEKIVEVQIRTQEMDEDAEEGIAAHWSYKKIKSDKSFEKKIGWLKSLINLQLEKKGDDLLKEVKIDLFGKRIHCYTPKGEFISLPEGSTILDFAYHIHNDLGDKAVAGRVNQKFSPLRKELSQGDIIEIITNKNQRPRREWLKFVVSKRAISSIRKSIKKHEKIGVPKKIFFRKKDKETFDPLVYSDIFQDHEITLAKCCNPLPFEELVGIEKSQKKVVVHSKDCEKIKSSGKITPMYWKDSPESVFLLMIEASERSGVLAELLNILLNENFTVKEVKAKIPSEGRMVCIFTLFPKRMDEIKKTLERISKIKGFKKAYFEN